MHATGLAKCAGALIAVAVISACGGGSAPPAPSSTLNVSYVGPTLSVNGTLVTAARVNPNPPSRYAPILPDPQRKSKKFEYIINRYGTYASIFDYPKSDSQIGTIHNVGGQGCTDVLSGYGNGIFWIVAADNQITEYRVPQKAIKTLSDSIGQPSSCGMNASGDLAVGLLNGQGAGDVIIFKDASGKGTVKKTPLSREYFDGYDPEGNLFADGFTSSSFASTLVELSKSGGAFHKVTTSNRVGFPGSVQWDGKYLAITDQQTNYIYRYTVEGTKADLKGTVRLNGAGDCAQTWIVPNYVYCGDAGLSEGEVFKYPAGGSPVAFFEGSFDFPLGVTASEEK
jgi:hypothetical protein